MHAKTVLIDEDVVIVGTCNWDIRSMLLHDEVVAVIHDRQRAEECANQYESDLGSCHEVTAAEPAALGTLRRTRNSVCRLTSRLL